MLDFSPIDKLARIHTLRKAQRVGGVCWPHWPNIKIDQKRKIHLQILDTWCKNGGQKNRQLKKEISTMSFFVKSS